MEKKNPTPSQNSVKEDSVKEDSPCAMEWNVESLRAAATITALALFLVAVLGFSGGVHRKLFQVMRYYSIILLQEKLREGESFIHRICSCLCCLCHSQATSVCLLSFCLSVCLSLSPCLPVSLSTLSGSPDYQLHNY